MRGRAAAIACAFVLLCTALLTNGQRALDARAMEAERALAIARGVAFAAAQEAAREDDAAAGLTQRVVTALAAKNGATLAEVFVLQGTQFTVHSDSARVSKRLDRDSLEDKALYDALARLKATVKNNADAREKDPALAQNPYPAEDVLRTDVGVIARVPVVDEGNVTAMVHVRTLPAPVALPWPLLAFLLPIGVGLALLAVLDRLPRGLAVAIGAAGVAALVIATGASLVEWRDGVRRARAADRAVAYAALAEAGVLDAAGPVADEALRAAHQALFTQLDTDAFAHPRGELVSIGPTSAAAVADIPAGDAVAVGSTTTIFSADGFAAARARDRGDITKWSALFAAGALMLFLLGSFGVLARFFGAIAEHKSAYAYLSPAMAGMGVLVFIPVIFGIVLGFMTREYNVWRFAGLSNFIAILVQTDITDPTTFYFKLAVTLLWTVTNVALHVGIGLALALMLNDPILKARGIYRVLLIVPWAIPNYITALIWKGMFHKQFGAINAFLAVMGVEPVAWFQSFWPAFFTNLSTNTWLGFPFMMVVSLGALQSIPADLYEAAWVDGASRWQRFRNITLPLLMPALVPAVITGSVWTFNMFNIIYLVSGGAPDGQTDILITDAFRWAFERDNYGYAAAYSTLIFLILLGFTALTNRITGATKGAFD